MSALEDSWEILMGDIKEVYYFDSERRPQDRAHDYIRRRRVRRGSDDTALQVVAQDIAGRAYDLGRADAVHALDGADDLAAKLTTLSGGLMSLALEMRGVRLAAELAAPAPAQRADADGGGDGR